MTTPSVSRRRDDALAGRMFDLARLHAGDSEFRALARELPSMLQRSGLLATLTVLAASDRNTAGGYAAAALTEEIDTRLGRPPTDTLTLIGSLTGTSGDAATHNRDVLVAERHAADVALWLKRFVEALEVDERTRAARERA